MRSRHKLDPDVLLRAYASGIFPMADNARSADVFWVEPQWRGIIPLDDFHLPRRLARTLKSDVFHLTVDKAFGAVLDGCAAAAPGRTETWINPAIADAYRTLSVRGQAHSIEVWTADGQLAGGLYGVRMGAAFFGESMFTRVTDASKCALAALVARLRVGGFRLLDTQFLTEHLAGFGAIELPARDYKGLLAPALAASGDFFALEALVAAESPRPATTVSGPVSGKRIVQLLTQTS